MVNLSPSWQRIISQASLNDLRKTVRAGDERRTGKSRHVLHRSLGFLPKDTFAEWNQLRNDLANLAMKRLQEEQPSFPVGTQANLAWAFGAAMIAQTYWRELSLPTYKTLIGPAKILHPVLNQALDQKQTSISLPCCKAKVNISLNSTSEQKYLRSCPSCHKRWRVCRDDQVFSFYPLGTNIPKDLERAKVYKAEALVSGGQILPDLKSCQDFVQTTLQSRVFRERFGQEVHPSWHPQIRERATAHSPFVRAMAMTLPKRASARSTKILLHELAHLVVLEPPPHGTKWRQTYLWLLENFISLEMAEAMKRSFLQMDLSQDDPTLEISSL